MKEYIGYRINSLNPMLNKINKNLLYYVWLRFVRLMLYIGGPLMRNHKSFVFPYVDSFHLLKGNKLNIFNPKKNIYDRFKELTGISYSELIPHNIYKKRLAKDYLTKITDNHISNEELHAKYFYKNSEFINWAINFCLTNSYFLNELDDKLFKNYYISYLKKFKTIKTEHQPKEIVNLFSFESQVRTIKDVPSLYEEYIHSK